MSDEPREPKPPAGADDMPAKHWSQVTGHMHHVDQASPGVGDWTIVVVSLAILVVSLVLSVRYLLRPGELGEDHIKRRILRD